MALRLRTLLPLLPLCGLLSCKKDLLHWQTAHQLETYGAHRLNNIRFINDTLGVVVGGDRFYAAEILTTRDGGYTWQLTSHPDAGKELFGLTVAPGGIYTVGFDGKLLRSVDNGKSWTFRQLSSWRPCKAIAFSGPEEAIVISGISFDTGWREYLDSLGNSRSETALDYELNDLVLLPGGTGYCSGYGVLLKTMDNGRTWALSGPNEDNFTALAVLSPDQVWTCGYNGSIYRTTDGGASWKRQRNGNDLTHPRYHLQDILFTDEQHGYAVGEDGLVIYSDDGGDHWAELDRFTHRHLRSIARCPNGDLLICGDGGTLYRLVR